MKKLIKNILYKAGYRVIDMKYRLRPIVDQINVIDIEFDHVISKYLLEKNDPSDFTFIQVGAFDGVECDPLRKYLLRFDWKGILLEPQPAPYSRLSSLYENRRNLSVLNVALSSQSGKTELYVVEGADLPEWAKGMASFDRNTILKHSYLLPDIGRYIRQIQIDTVSFGNLLDDHSIESLDLLQIDTEGFDAEVINLFPFEILKPSIIHFESKHIPKNNLEQLLYKLINLGYSIAQDRSEDMMAVLTNSRSY